MNEWWQSLEQRERYFVGGLGVFLVAFLFYMLLLEPLFVGAAEYRDKVDTAQEDLAYMQSVAPILRARGAQPTATRNTGGPLAVVVDRASTRMGITTERTSSVGDDGLRITVDDTPFDAIVRMLGSLNAQHGIVVESANVRPGDQTGTVNATLTLRRQP